MAPPRRATKTGAGAAVSDSFQTDRLCRLSVARDAAPAHCRRGEDLGAVNKIRHGNPLVRAVDAPARLADAPDQAVLIEWIPEVRVADEGRDRHRRRLAQRRL